MVKICGITRREDAEAAVEAGASALGFIFYPPSPRYVPPERAADLAQDLNVLKVGVFVNETRATVEAVARAAKLGVVQLYGGDAPDGLRVWRAFRMNEEIHSEQAHDAEAVLLDGPANGIPFDWTKARHAGEMKLILAGGLDASNVAEAIRVAKPWGVDASSKLETAPGIKDHEKVRRFIEAARNAA
jgi:phosphoribosylanthranilate isomerase